MLSRLRRSETEPRVIIGENSIQVEQVEPKTTDNYVWGSHYDFGSLYLKGEANPIEITEARGTALRQEDYKTFMQQNVLRDAFDTQGRSEDLMVKLLIANIAGVVLLIMIVLFFMGG